jgi:serine/threonine protein kinase
MFEQRIVGGFFQVVSELSSGGFGQTFLAADLRRSDGARCVVKQLKPQSNAPEVLDLAKRLFEQEVRTLYQLGEHPQIPSIITHFEEAGEFYFVQEHIEGNTFAQEIAAGRVFSQRQVIEIVNDLLSVLAFVHRNDVIHRDIKPSNLICRKSDGKTVLIDFGAVKQLRNQNAVNPSQVTTGTVAIGSEGYMPMEQLAGHPKFSSDVYAVGMFAIQLVTQTHPTRLRQSQRTGEWIWQDKASVNVQFAEFLNRMIRYDFRQRFADAGQALNYLQGLNLSAERSENPYWNQNSNFGVETDQRQTQATFFAPVPTPPEIPKVNQPPVHHPQNYQPINVEPIFAPQPFLPRFSPNRMQVVESLKPIGAPPIVNPSVQNTQAMTGAAVPYKLGTSERVEMGESLTVGSSAFDGFGENRFLKTLIYAVVIILASGTLIYTFVGMVQTQQHESQMMYSPPPPPVQLQPSPAQLRPRETPRSALNSGFMSLALQKEAKATSKDDWYAVAWEWKNAEEYYARVESLAVSPEEKELARKDKEFCTSKKESAFKTSESMNKKITRRLR